MITLWERRDGGSAVELLTHALRQRYGIRELPELARAEGGKPWFPARPDLHFNLSHSGDLVLCGVGDVPLGVDVEPICVRRDSLSRHTLSPREYAWFEARGSRWEDYYTLWTMKESRCKYTGRGLDVAPRELEVPLLNPGESGELDGLVFRAYGGEGWRAALCAAAPCVLPTEIFPWRETAKADDLP